MISRLKVFCGLCLLLAAGQLFAASSREQRAYSAAVAAFHDGIYARAEAEFGQFIDKYPDSTNAPQAVLLQAQAQIKQDKFTNAITLLTAKRSAAGPLEDQYAYWTGEAQFDAGDLDAAVQTFDSLARQFPASRLALRGTVEAAAVRAKREDWPGIVNALAETGGAFPRMAKLDPRNEDVSTGYLLLAQAELMRQDPRAALAVLTNLDVHTLKPQQNWQQLNLGEQSRLAIGDNAAALVDTTNMLQLARLEKRGDWAADAFAIRADIFEKMNRPDDAIAAYRENLAATAPVPRQRQAILEIAEISAAQKSTSAATESLEDYLRRFPDSAQADIATLAIGELELKNFAAESGPTDLLAAAHARFDAFINTFTNSPLLGNALLDRGWCFWLEGNTPQSLADFQAAVQKLSPSTELAVAKFKVGDDLFLQRDFEGARENYRAVLALTNFPAVSRTLADRALYQELRASLELKDQRGAMQALVPLLRHYPSSELLHPAEILYGEGLSDSFGKPEQARITFETFEQQYPNSPEEPQVELAIAHTFELQQDWTNAVARYQTWLERFPDNDLRSRVAYSLGLADFHAGAESNAVVVFTNFLTQFPTSEYAPLAQWWIADHYFRAAEWVGAETNYERVYQLWPTADVNLAYQARIMAGRSAAARQGNSDAMNYYAGVINDTNCPPELAAQARFALGSFLMRAESTDTNNPFANYSTATNFFGQIVQMFPTNEIAALALGAMGNCDFQLGDYVGATNAYLRVIDHPAAPLTARCEAKVGIGRVLEKLAGQAADADRTNLLHQACRNYLDVFYSDSGFYRDGEQPDDFWAKKAGLQALPLLESLGAAEPAKFIERMETLLPQLKNSLEIDRQKILSQKS